MELKEIARHLKENIKKKKQLMQEVNSGTRELGKFVKYL